VFRTIIWPRCAAHNSMRLKNPEKCSLFSGSENTKVKEGLVTWDGYSFFQCCTTPNHLPHNYWTDPTLSAKTKHNKINGFQDHYSTFIGSITQPISQSINQSTNEKEQTPVVKRVDSTFIGSVTQPISQSIIPPSEQVSQPFMIHWGLKLMIQQAWSLHWVQMTQKNKHS